MNKNKYQDAFVHDHVSVTRGLHESTKRRLVGYGLGIVATGSIYGGMQLISLEDGPPADQELIEKGWTQDQVDAMHQAKDLPAPVDTFITVPADQLDPSQNG